ncbi:MAG: hypothetical protein U0Q16_11590 [Bryobacteraceae bacterium]
MAKIKPVNRNKTKLSQTRGLIPCGLLILAAMGLFGLLFYSALKSSVR